MKRTKFLPAVRKKENPDTPSVQSIAQIGKPGQLYELWSELCARYHGMSLEKMAGKTGAMSRDVLKALNAKGLDPVTFVREVVTNWGNLEHKLRAVVEDRPVKLVPKPSIGQVALWRDQLVEIVPELIEDRARAAQQEALWRALQVEREAKAEAEREANRKAEAAHRKAWKERLAYLRSVTVAQFEAFSEEEKGDFHDSIPGKLYEYLSPEMTRAVCNWMFGEDEMEEMIAKEQAEHAEKVARWSALTVAEPVVAVDPAIAALYAVEPLKDAAADAEKADHAAPTEQWPVVCHGKVDNYDPEEAMREYGLDLESGYAAVEQEQEMMKKGGVDTEEDDFEQPVIQPEPAPRPIKPVIRPRLRGGVSDLLKQRRKIDPAKLEEMVPTKYGVIVPYPTKQPAAA
jgi:hypothetical protein